MTDARVKLRGRLSQSSSSAYIRPDGSLVIEFYDFSDQAQQSLGRDAAFLMILVPEQKTGILNLLAAEDGAPPFSLSGDQALLELIQKRFVDYYDVQKWLTGLSIPYEKDFDSWA